MGVKTYLMDDRLVRLSGIPEGNAVDELASYPELTPEALTPEVVRSLALLGAATALIGNNHFRERRCRQILLPDDLPDWLAERITQLIPLAPVENPAPEEAREGARESQLATAGS